MNYLATLILFMLAKLLVMKYYLLNIRGSFCVFAEVAK